LTDNDRRGWKPQRKLKQWYEYELKSKQTTVINTPTNELAIRTEFSLINDSASVKINYTINNRGVIRVDYWLDVKPGLPNIPKIGMQGGINKIIHRSNILVVVLLKIILTNAMERMLVYIVC
jgi:beta-galactosidase